MAERRTVYVLMENQAHEGGVTRGVYSTRERAEAEAGEDGDITYWSVVPAELDAVQGFLEQITLRD